MLVEWRPAARERLHDIIDYIADRNFQAALDLLDTIERLTSALPQHPYLYRAGRVPGTREMVVHPNYIVVYRVGHTIDIVTVLHARQAFP